MQQKYLSKSQTICYSIISFHDKQTCLFLIVIYKHQNKSRTSWQIYDLAKMQFIFSNPLSFAYFSCLMFFDKNVNFKCHLKFPFCYMHRSIIRRLKCHSWEKSILPESNDRKMTDKAVWMFIHGHIINVISTSARVKSWNISLDRNKFLVKERVIVFYITLRDILYNSYGIHISINL